MTVPDREQQILAMLDALSQCKPRDMDELTAWVRDEDTPTGRDSLPAPIFTLTLSPYDIVRIADGEKE